MRIAVVSHPRSGSTYLCGLLGDVLDASVVMEPFHSNVDVARQHLRSALGEEYDGFAHEYDGRLSADLEARLKDPLAYLSLIEKYTPRNCLIFKIFPGHLNQERLAEVLKACDRVVFLHRNTLHAYISEEIARGLGKYANVATSDRRIEFNSNRYAFWNNRKVEFLHAAAEIASRDDVGYIDLDYEPVSASADPRSYLADVIGSGKRASNKLRDVVSKQDGRTLATDKVSNPESLVSFLESKKLEALNASFNPSPRVIIDG